MNNIAWSISLTNGFGIHLGLINEPIYTLENEDVSSDDYGFVGFRFLFLIFDIRIGEVVQYED